MTITRDKKGFGKFYQLKDTICTELPIKYITKDNNKGYTEVKIGDGIREYLKQLYSN